MKLAVAMSAVVVFALSTWAYCAPLEESELRLDTLAPLVMTLEAAHAGHGQAMLQLALAGLFAHDGATFAPAIARVWLVRAHEAGQTQATWLLGQMVRDGVSLPADPGRAMRLLDQAATQGQPRAMVEMALAYWEGENVQADPVQAVIWMRSAHEAGDTLASSLLAQWMLEGAGDMAADPQAALELLRLAAARGQAAALRVLSIMYQEGLGVAADQQQAAYWSDRFEQQSTAQSLYELGMLFDQGRGVAHDPAFARELYDMAFARADTAATLVFCARLIMGLGVPADVDLASGYLRVAVETLDPSILALAGRLWVGHDEVRRLMFWQELLELLAFERFAALATVQGHRYASGVGVEADADKAVAFYRKAIERGDAAAATALGLLFVADQPQRAMPVLELAAAWGDPRAMLVLADLLAGQGEEASSAFWLREAAQSGDVQAIAMFAALDKEDTE